MRTFTNKKAVPVKQTAKQKLQYVRKNWQLYLFFLMPALLLTIIFKYIPMSGVLIAFEDYNVIDGVFGSEWVGLEYFQRFLSSPDFMNYLMNTLKLRYRKISSTFLLDLFENNFFILVVDNSFLCCNILILSLSIFLNDLITR